MNVEDVVERFETDGCNLIEAAFTGGVHLVFAPVKPTTKLIEVWENGRGVWAEVTAVQDRVANVDPRGARLHAAALALRRRRHGPAPLLRALRPVGYHVWVGDATLGTFVLGRPNALVLVDPSTERADTLARDIGRALVRVPGRDAFTFLQQGRDTSWISEVDVRTRAVTRLVAAPPGADYHLWTPGGRLIAAVGTRILVHVGDRWDTVADFAELGIRGISRLALSPRGDQRNESCGGHFREEYQYPDGEAKRDDENMAYVAAWKYNGANQEPSLVKEPLVFENVKPAQRSYK